MSCEICHARVLNTLNNRQEFVSTAYYNGQKMALKQINMESINLNRSWYFSYSFFSLCSRPCIFPNLSVFPGHCFLNWSRWRICTTTTSPGGLEPVLRKVCQSTSWNANLDKFDWFCFFGCLEENVCHLISWNANLENGSFDFVSWSELHKMSVWLSRILLYDNRVLPLRVATRLCYHCHHLITIIIIIITGFSFMITEYCPRGSLQDILEDSDFELDTDFRLTIMIIIKFYENVPFSSSLKILGYPW